MPFILKKTITETFFERAKLTPHAIAFQYKNQEKSWTKVSFQAFFEECRRVSFGLMGLEIRPQDKVALISNTRYEWTLADFSILGAGAITVPIYASNTPEDVAYILNHSEAKVVFVENETQFKKLQKQDLPHLKKIILFEGTAQNGALTLESLKELGKLEEAKTPALFESRLLGSEPKDLVTLCYTSGTTGVPKGAMLSHENFMSMLENCVHAFSKTLKPEKEVILFFLPFSHIIGKAESFATHVFGWKGAFAESQDKLMENLNEIEPTLIFSVPRIFEKAWAKISQKIEMSSTFKRSLFNHALHVGHLCHFGTPSLTDKAKYSLAKKILFQKITKIFGGKLKFAVCGGAPLPQKLSEIFQVFGLTLLEGYGLTETCGPITLNTPTHKKLGAVGKPMHDVSIKTAEDGEILLQSRSVFRGYYKMEAESVAVLENGWFKTGDIGHIDLDGFLQITDRKKDLIITSAGKNIAPQKIESLIKISKYINQFMVHGDRRNYLTALVTLNKELVIHYAHQRKILFSDYFELIKNPKIQNLIQAEVDQVNDKLASFEKIKKFTILPSDFSIETGDMTPSMKIKRGVVAHKFRLELDRMYS